jgi:MFS family permease
MMPKKTRIYYGYWILLATFMSLLLMSGCVYWGFSLFISPLQTDFGWNRGEIMVSFTIYSLIGGLSSPFIGRIVDRFGPKKIIVIGALVSGLGLASLYLLSNIWHLYIAYAVVGVGAVGMGPIAQSTIVSNWFHRKRGLAIGIMATGIGVGGFVLSPLIGSFLIPNLGWRPAYLVLAILTWGLIVPIALIIIKAKPADIGLYPDGAQAPPAVDSSILRAAPLSSGLTPRMALATSAFWLMAVSFLLGSFVQVGVIQSEVSYLTDIGFAAGLVATIHGLSGLSSGVGKFCFGWVCDHLAPRYAAAIGHILVVLAVILLLNLTPQSPGILVWLYPLVIGLGMGSWLPTMSILTSANFGLAAYGTIFGMVALAQSIGSSTGPLFAGAIFDALHNYRLAFTIFLSLYVVAIPAMLLVRRPRSMNTPNLVEQPASEADRS